MLRMLHTRGEFWAFYTFRFAPRVAITLRHATHAVFLPRLPRPFSVALFEGSVNLKWRNPGLRLRRHPGLHAFAPSGLSDYWLL